MLDLRQIASCVWPKYSETVDAVNYNARYRAWLREHKPTMFESRRALHAEIQETLIGPQPITYLEFGVWEGKSLAMWAELNRNPKSRFHGFDSFEGLPEASKTWGKAGLFAVDSMPRFEDERVGLWPGWFNTMLPKFLAAGIPTRRLIVHIDCDLYSSTLYVLTMLDRLLVPGSIVLFDETVVADHEFRALLDWASAYGRNYAVIGGFEKDGRTEGVALEMRAAADG